MKNKMKRYFLFQISLFCIFLFSACSTVTTTGIKRVGLVPLHSYTLKQPPASDTVFKVINSKDVFDANYALTATATNAIVPDFNGQTVVAIILPALSAVQFDHAEIDGNTMNVYAISCAPGNQNCVTNLALATTPKSGNVKTVQFIINGVSRFYVDL
jgi:hypothetical protein